MHRVTARARLYGLIDELRPYMHRDGTYDVDALRTELLRLSASMPESAWVRLALRKGFRLPKDGHYPPTAWLVDCINHVRNHVNSRIVGDGPVWFRGLHKEGTVV